MIGILKTNRNLQTAIEASLKAGEAIIQVYLKDGFNIEIKGDNSPLTEADKKANDIINSLLVPTKIPIISEENKQINYSIRKKWKICWIVDPVDGTKEFIKRNGEFTVNIALVNNGKPVLGVIYVPVSKTLYFADVIKNKGYKAILNSHNDSIEEVIEKATLLAPKNNDSDKVEVVGSRSHMSQETLEYIAKLKKQGRNVEVVSKGSSLKFCLVAEGNADVYPRFAPTMEWDTAAGQAICQSVNIDIISLDTNKTLLYNKENLLNPWFICNDMSS